MAYCVGLAQCFNDVGFTKLRILLAQKYSCPSVKIPKRGEDAHVITHAVLTVHNWTYACHIYR